MAKPIFEPDFALYRKPGFYETMELQDNDKSRSEEHTSELQSQR